MASDAAAGHTPRGVCVCGRSAPKVWGEGGPARTKPQDGGARPRRGRGLRPRRFRLRTTTNYILVLVCSSTGRENNSKVTLGEVCDRA